MSLCEGQRFLQCVLPKAIEQRGLTAPMCSAPVGWERIAHVHAPSSVILHSSIRKNCYGAYEKPLYYHHIGELENARCFSEAVPSSEWYTDRNKNRMWKRQWEKHSHSLSDGHGSPFVLLRTAGTQCSRRAHDKCHRGFFELVSENLDEWTPSPVGNISMQGTTFVIKSMPRTRGNVLPLRRTFQATPVFEINSHASGYCVTAIEVSRRTTSSRTALRAASDGARCFSTLRTRISFRCLGTDPCSRPKKGGLFLRTVR